MSDDEEEKRHSTRRRRGRGAPRRGSCRGGGLLVLAGCGGGALLHATRGRCPPRRRGCAADGLPARREEAAEDGEPLPRSPPPRSRGGSEKTIFPGRRSGGSRGSRKPHQAGPQLSPEERAAEAGRCARREGRAGANNGPRPRPRSTDRDRHAAGGARANAAKVRQGIVVSDKGEKSITVGSTSSVVTRPTRRWCAVAHSARPRRAQRGQRGRRRAAGRDPATVEDQALAPGRGRGEGEVSAT